MVLHDPYLKPSEVHAAMVYHLDYRAEIDAEIEREIDELKQMGDNTQSVPWQKPISKGVV